MSTAIFPQMILRVCGTDIHKDVIVTISGESLEAEPRSYKTFSTSLTKFTAWLLATGITHVAMESAFSILGCCKSLNGGTIITNILASLQVRSFVLPKRYKINLLRVKNCSLLARSTNYLRMQIRNIIILVTSIFLLFSCEKEEFEQEINQRTIFMYLPWSTNLTSYFYNNISDMEEAMKEKGLQGTRVIVFLSTSSSESQMFELTLDNSICTRSVLKEYQDPLFTTVSGLTDIINDMKTFAPAQRYSMIIGCHGMGWLPVNDSESRAGRTFKYHWEYTNVPHTRFFGGLSPEYQTDISTLAKSIANNGLFMEYILFDDCYMSSVEVAYELRNVTNYMIACPTEIMAFGMPYSTIGKYLLSDNPDYGAICEAFYQFYSTYEHPYGTLAVTNCGELDNLASIMKRINERHYFDGHKEALIQRMDGYTPIIFYDYGDYVRALCGKDTDMFNNFSKILDRVIPYKTHTEQYYSASRGIIPIYSYSGITTSEPSGNTKTANYKRTSWYIDTH